MGRKEERSRTASWGALRFRRQVQEAEDSVWGTASPTMCTPAERRESPKSTSPTPPPRCQGLWISPKPPRWSAAPHTAPRAPCYILEASFPHLPRKLGCCPVTLSYLHSWTEGKRVETKHTLKGTSLPYGRAQKLRSPRKGVRRLFGPGVLHVDAIQDSLLLIIHYHSLLLLSPRKTPSRSALEGVG